MKVILITTVLVVFNCTSTVAQKLYDAWCFGNSCGLSINTNSISPFSSMINTQEGCAGIADAQGGLLFYTDGVDIRNKFHLLMPNGNGLSGGPSSTQSALIEKLPASNNLYYVFTVGENGTGQLCYSIVDMNLAGGTGSVTVKNVVLATNCSEKLISTRHCNGSDTWIVSHDMLNNTFRSFLLTSNGLSNVAVISQTGSIHAGFESYGGSMKLSPSGKKLAVAVSGTSGFFELFDFNFSTGVVSNPLKLIALAPYAYGCEFSPDGTKLYGIRVLTTSQLLQWNLCAGDSTAIKGSLYSNYYGGSLGSMQLASNGKIYVAKYNQYALGVIQSPNLTGASCNFVQAGQVTGTGQCKFGLPNFNTSRLHFPDPPIVDTILTCNTRRFSFPSQVLQSTQNCQSVARILQTYRWQFGDSASGPLDTSTVLHPTHVYQSAGTYTVKLILVYECDLVDTVYKTLTVLPSCSVTVQVSQNCMSQVGTGSVTPGPMMPGPLTCTWMPGMLTGTVVNGLLPGTYTVFAFNQSSQSIMTVAVIVPTVEPINFLQVTHSSSVSCFSAANATAAIYHQGQLFSNWPVTWTNGLLSYTGSVVQQLSAGTWTAFINGYNSYCNFSESFVILQPSPVVSSILANDTTACVNASISLQASATGGHPYNNSVYSYTWSGGSNNNNHQFSSSNPGTYTIHLIAKDSLNCSGTSSLILTFVPIPTLVVSSISLCPQQIGLLHASGANNYLWSGTQSGPTLMVQGSADQTIHVVGSVLSCTTSELGYVKVYPEPVLTCTSNSPLCANQTLQLFASGAIAYSWTGPSGFNSLAQNPFIQNCQTSGSGLYQLILVDSNSCSYSRSITVVVNANPTLSLPTSTTVCAFDDVFLQASGSAGLNCTWLGPNALNSPGSLLIIPQASPINAGNYFLLFSDSLNCSNTCSISLWVEALPNVNVLAPPVCYSSSASLTALGASSFSWLGPNGFSMTSNPLVIPSATNTAPLNYTLTGYSTNGCSNTVTTALITRPLPGVTYTATERACANGFVYFTGGGGDYYLWNGPQNFYSAQKSFTLFANSVFYSGDYTLTVGDQFGCQSYTSIPLRIDPLPSIVVKSKNTKACLPFCSEFTFEDKSESPITVFEWSTPLQTGSEQKFVKCWDEPGMKYVQLKVQDAQGCQTETTAVVEAYPVPVANFSFSPAMPKENFEPVYFTSLSSGQNISAWTWQLNEKNSTNTTGEATQMAFENAGKYVVVLHVENEWGCRDTIAKMLEVTEDMSVYVPNAFTPNKDGLNDTFYPVIRGVKEFELQVFDRWGGLVHSTMDVKTPWDGTYLGETCKEDVYSYKLVLSDKTGHAKVRTGSVFLYR